MSHALTWLDVFSATPLAGNQLAVVHDADDLDHATMLGFARETRLSETTYVQRATEDGADYRNRIWFPRGEMPFAGHPSLGTAVAVAAAAQADAAQYVQQTGAGLQPVEVERAGAVWRASMLQGAPLIGDELDAGEILGAVGLSAADAHPELPPQLMSTGLPQVVAPVRDDAALERARGDYAAMERVLVPLGVDMIIVSVIDGERARSRALYLDLGFANEDPATGSAAGSLVTYLHARGVASRVVIEQGAQIARPSVLHAAIEDGRARVGGDCVLVATGTLAI
ncbi:MAG TPA: PhzF family phenazine biosynthesis protein [Solirubrobacteraceae bacterium]